MEIGALPLVRPFPWRALLAYLAPRGTPGAEQVEGDRYRRRLATGGVVSVSLAPGGGALRVAAPADPLRVIGSRSHGGEALEAWLARLPGDHTFVAAGSSLKFCRIADGRADIYPRFGPTSQWDTAAAQGVLEIAGGAVTDLAGAPLRYGLERPVLNPEFVAVGAAELLALVAAG